MHGTGIQNLTGKKGKSKFPAAMRRVSALDWLLMCILTKFTAQKSFSDLTHSAFSWVNTVSQKVFPLRGYRRDEVGRSRKDSFGFLTGDADASSSHGQDREDDDPGMTALGCETDAWFCEPQTQYLTYLGPKTQTCATQHLVPVQQCGEHKALEAHQILQKHSQLSQGLNNS